MISRPLLAKKAISKPQKKQMLSLEVYFAQIKIQKEEQESSQYFLDCEDSDLIESDETSSSFSSPEEKSKQFSFR